MIQRNVAVAIDPEILAARAVMAAATGPFDIMALTPAQGRALIDKASMALNDGLPEMAQVEDHVVRGIRVRLYTPQEVTALGWLYYLHGGGWYACSVDTHDRMLRLLAQQTGARVVSPDYRHAPENPYPVPLNDCAKAFDWAAARGLGDRFAFAGDSAGANMALALAMRLRDAGRAIPAGLALLYGCFDPGEPTLSMRTFGHGAHGLTAERMNWYLGNYLNGSEAAEASPLRLNADLHGLPPVFLGIAEADTVADDSRLLEARLRGAGVQVEHTLWKGAVHGFLQMTRDVTLARKAVADTASAIRRWIGTQRS